ncbi:hypothetical protein PH210_07560 [Paenibacillus sp. BSR1-1]|uniref:hypothetical protein n=1 Tax=Paenibacillus sp. BSR1-1 TaxID=3020845 RepID=UPI0025B1B0F5|nr:hypothetical protein [Paenibacillus sp. BSR1-1]MDN3016064.1 hypothetical protein [Paenibacillus sp. BSR1-1]
MDQKYIDKSPSHEVTILIDEIHLLNRKIDLLKSKIQFIQSQCKHIFLETPGMRECQRCGFAESTYY